MKLRLLLPSLILVVSSMFTACHQESGNQVKKLNATEFSQSVAESDVQLIDVRSPEEYNAGHIEGAVNINIGDADFEERLSLLSRERKLLLYCGSGMRSAKAAGIAGEKGFNKIYDLEGGIQSWTQAGLPVSQ